jgi:hypothetical protein
MNKNVSNTLTTHAFLIIKGHKGRPMKIRENRNNRENRIALEIEINLENL